jgi:hypothetical protein
MNVKVKVSTALLIENPSNPSILGTAETWKISKEQVKNGRRFTAKDKRTGCGGLVLFINAPTRNSFGPRGGFN